MIQLRGINELREWRQELGHPGPGFVPTMGALHAGHMELIQRSIAGNPVTLVSIFVNPVQFNDPEDCENYPQPLDADLAACKEAGVDAVFLPKYADLYPDSFAYRVEENRLSHLLEGEHRPGHFTGVLTVVLKLLILALPARAYFGEKDWQQLKLVEGLAKAFLLPTEIIGVPTIRESDGLAMSSRNVRLSREARAKAPEFYRVLSTAPDEDAARRALEILGFVVEYIADHEGRRLGAVQLDGVRLIDNLPLANVRPEPVREICS